MWIVLGGGAIAFAVLNVVWTFKNRNAKWFRYISMSLTALTLCAFYSDEALRVIREDWSGLMDVMPTMRRALWCCTVASIVINSVSLFNQKD